MLGNMPQELEGLSDKNLALLCDCLASNNAIQISDLEGEVCLAHLAEGRVHKCGVIHSSVHIRDENPFGRCQDFELIPKTKQGDLKLK